MHYSQALARCHIMKCKSSKMCQAYKAPVYISNLLTPYAPSGPEDPRMNFYWFYLGLILTKGLTVAGRKLWNSLPIEITSTACRDF